MIIFLGILGVIAFLWGLAIMNKKIDIISKCGIILIIS